jgi:hypothetical protein
MLARAAKIGALLLWFTSCSCFVRFLFTWKRQFFVPLEQASQVIYQVKKEALALNRQCSMYQDVVGIYHHPASAALSVVLQSNDEAPNNHQRSCLQPYLIARLSGPAVGLVHQWHCSRSSAPSGVETSSVTESAVSGIMVGHYDVPIPGEYFLEIIVVLCNDYDRSMMRRAKNYTYVEQNEIGAVAVFEREQQHIVQQCVQDPDFHRLTALNTSILVVKPSHHSIKRSNSSRAAKIAENESNQKELRGYWVRHADGMKQDMINDPLYTRYQPKECIGVRHDDCIHPAASQARFEPYQFAWTLSTPGRHGDKVAMNGTAKPNAMLVFDEKVLSDKVRLKSQARLNNSFCVFGDSHAAQLAKHLTSLLSNPVIAVSIKFATTLGESISRSGSGESVTERVIQQLERSYGSKMAPCSIVVLQIAHWDASFVGGFPTSVSLYERNMYQTIQNLRMAMPSARVVVWSPHSMVLGSRKYSPPGQFYSCHAWLLT